MNLFYLKYAAEVERTGSITEVAQNSYMNQPHLSKITQELERDLGCPIFDHTSRGAVPTKREGGFLCYARAILVQEEQIESLCVKDSERTLEISPSMPKATYISYAFANYLKDMRSFPSVSLGYKETNSQDTVHGVFPKSFNLGITRCRTLYESYYMKTPQDENLDWKELWELSCNVLMSVGYPLADRRHLTYLDSVGCMEVIQGDIQNPSSIFEVQDISAIGRNSRKTIPIYDRGSQFEIPRQILGTYMWISFVPHSCLEAMSLIQEPYSYPGNVHKGLSIYRNGYRSSRDENEFLYCLARMISRLSVQ